jgi:PPK2 family polyphosphate:nucleotide phosphotransferase
MAKLTLVEEGSRVQLGDIDPGGTGGIEKDEALEKLEALRPKMEQLQGQLHAEHRRSLLVVLQGMDAAGKDGTIQHVFSGLSPAGCQVFNCAKPSDEERAHDFLWRIYQQLPRRGNIGVFNRSHYEDVLVVRVRKIEPESEWRPRYAHINSFEKLISDLGTRVVKFFLHLSREEQRARILERLKDPTKNWKYSPADLEDRKLWNDYQEAYEEALSRCSTKVAPWYVVPADKKWYRNYAVAKKVLDVLEEMDPKPPKGDIDWRKIRVPR